MATIGQTPQAGPSAPQPPLESWLQGHGVGKYSDNFRRAGAGMDLLPILADADLRAMGVATLGARKRILLGVQEMKEEEASPSARENIPDHLKCFINMGVSGVRLPPPPAPAPRAPAPPPPSKKRGWAHAGATAAKYQRGGGGGGGGGRAAVLPIRPWQLVPGTSFVVDRFCNLPPTTPAHRHWFLTHFHADHYKGLTSKFARGTIYCTPVTAALVRLQLRVRPEAIQEVALGAAVTVEGCRVTFLPANHCPGAAMLLFEPPGRRPVLHSGDCRASPEAVEGLLPALAAARGAADLVLDTTYCDPQYTFPPQAEALRFVVDAVKAEAFNPATLFMVGSYTIGKERLYLQAAKALGCKVYVSATKKKVLDCLGLPPEEAALLTTDDGETNLHAVPLWMVSHKHMANSLKYYRGRFTNVVGFQPTGWTHGRDTAKAGAGAGRRRKKGTIITYQVPYSEHSSFSELKQFVEWLRPVTVLPSVNNDGNGPKAAAMVALLGAKLPRG